MGFALAANTKRQPEPDINITPLVDVVLVLLIIFMVIAPALESGEHIELPSVLMPDKEPKSKLDPVTLVVGKSGHIFLEQQPISEKDLEKKLKIIHSKTPDRKVTLKGDGKLDYENVRGVFLAVQKAGFSGCSLMVEKAKGPGDKPEDSEK